MYKGGSMHTKENIYKTILDHQGPKHPRLHYQALNAFADYLVEKLKSYVTHR